MLIKINKKDFLPVSSSLIATNFYGCSTDDLTATMYDSGDKLSTVIEVRCGLFDQYFNHFEV
jgi:hypothetical protein